jgi:predicted adenine nucleotide alpha hydrolase (AANH) superfamily ATPase
MMAGEVMRVRLVLHACCGPCLLEPYDALSADADVLVVYANPNINPVEEYERRRDTLMAYARGRGIDVVEEPYDPQAWEDAVIGLEHDPGRRCRACFGLRIGMAARRAASLGYDAVATTLTVSPYQDPVAIREAGESACAAEGVAFLVTDFRDRYPDATRRSRELGMYRQNFCGCVYSEAEAGAERERRRGERAARLGTG